jgi:hypothetical protein
MWEKIVEEYFSSNKHRLGVFPLLMEEYWIMFEQHNF